MSFNNRAGSVAEIIEQKLVYRRTITEALRLENAVTPRIAAVGAGGKTTILKKLAAEYRKAGQKPVVTTTTHMFTEPSPLFLLDPSFEEIQSLLKKEGCAFAGSMAGEGKMKMLPDRILDAVFELPVPVLLEADGAKMLPVKFPAAHEPALPPQTTCVLSVYGMRAIGRSIQEVGFRPKLLADFLQKRITDKLKPHDIARLAQSAQAGRKSVRRDMQYIVILNQADTWDLRRAAIDIWRAMEQEGQRVLVTSWQTNSNEL